MESSKHAIVTRYLNLTMLQIVLGIKEFLQGLP
jgi:hypothetical protein